MFNFELYLFQLVNLDGWMEGGGIVIVTLLEAVPGRMLTFH